MSRVGLRLNLGPSHDLRACVHPRPSVYVRAPAAAAGAGGGSGDDRGGAGQAGCVTHLGGISRSLVSAAVSSVVIATHRRAGQ